MLENDEDVETYTCMHVYNCVCTEICICAYIRIDIYIGKYDLSIIRKPILPLTSWDPPDVTLDPMRPPGCPPP